MDALGGETTFADVTAPEGVGFVPACTIGVSISILSHVSTITELPLLQSLSDRPESSRSLRSRRRLVEVVHHLRSARGLRTLLCVSNLWLRCLDPNHLLCPHSRNMKRAVTHWYTKDQPIFENNEDIPDCKIDVTRIPGGADTPPCLKISHNTFETMEKANWEFLRLSLPVTCDASFIE